MDGVRTMEFKKVLKSRFDYSISFDNLEEAKYYFIPDWNEQKEREEFENLYNFWSSFEDYKKDYLTCIDELKDCVSLDQFCDLLNIWDAFIPSGPYYMDIIKKR